MTTNYKIDKIEKITFISFLFAIVFSILFPYLIMYRNTSTFASNSHEIDKNSYVSYSLNDCAPNKYNLISKVNYVANSFTSVNKNDIGEIKNLNENIAKYGTIYVILDEFSFENEIDYQNTYKSYEHYINKVNNIEFALFIPSFFDVSYIYFNDSLIESNGSFEKYDSAKRDFTKCEGIISSKSFKTSIVKFSTQINYENQDKINQNIITIHYRLNDKLIIGNFSFLFGRYNLISHYKIFIQIQLIVGLIIACISFATLIPFVFIIKRNKNNYLLISIITLFFVYVLSLFFLKYDSSFVPNLWIYICLSCLSTMPFTLSSFRLNKYKLINFLFVIANSILIILNFIFLSINMDIYKITNFIFLLISVSEILISLYLTIKSQKTIDFIAIYMNIFIVISFFNSHNIYSLLSINFLYVILFATLIFLFVYYNLIITLYRNKLSLAKEINLDETIDNSNDMQKILRVLFHDLKNELILERNSLELLKANSTIKEKYSIINNLLEHNSHQLNLIKEGSEYAHKTFNPIKIESINIENLINNIYKQLFDDAKAVGINFYLKNIREGNVISSQFILESSIKNIIFNAIEHSKCKNLKIKTSKTTYSYIIKIIDDGVGIEDIKNIFAPYKKKDKNNEGLGLYLIKSQLNNANGRIELKNTKRGTTFKIFLLIDNSY